MRIRLALVIAIVAGLVAAGCGDDEGGGDGGAQPFTVALDFYVNPDHAGLFTAVDRGYFEHAGLDVDTVVPSDPSAPIRQVAADRVDLAISYEPEVVLARDQGLPVTAVAAVVPTPLTSMIWLGDSGITGVEDLGGTTIATAGIPYQAAFLDEILGRAGLSADDVDQVDVGLGLLPALLSGRADAMLGGYLNVEGVDLRERERDPVVTPVDRLGIPTYDELVLVANPDRIADDPEPIRGFVAALARGTRAAVADPAAATRSVLEHGDGLEPDLTRAEVDRTLPLLARHDGNTYGYMDPAAWDRFAAFFADRGLTDEQLSSDDLLTNELLGD